jgi:CDP-diacylglycerol--glycerol-3-phosphate 3-phosphatidyltransferase
MVIAVVLTVVTGLDYVRQAVVLRRQGLAREHAAAETERAAAASEDSTESAESTQ